MKYLLTFLFLISCYELMIAQSTSPDWAWARGADSSSFNMPQAVTTDIFGNVYHVGFFNSQYISFGSQTLTNNGNYDMYVVKYDSSGNVLWARQSICSGLDVANAVSTDDNGNVFVAGYFTNATIVFSTILLHNNGNEDYFVVKYDSAGNVNWAMSGGGGQMDVANGITSDNNGNIYVTGFFQSSAFIVSNDTLINPNLSLPRRIFLTRYDISGNVIWTKGYGGNDHDEASGVALDTSGNIFISGYFWSHLINFDNVTLVNSSAVSSVSDIFTAKLNPTGNIIWARRTGGTGQEESTAISCDASGNTYLSGNFSSQSFTFGSSTLVRNGLNKDVMILKYDMNGVEQWAKCAGNIYPDWAYGVATDSTGNSYLSGIFQYNYIVFDNDTLFNTIVPGGDIYIVKFSPTGNVLWTKSAGGEAISGASADFAYGLAANRQGDTFIAGTTYCPSIIFGNDTVYGSGFVVKLENNISTGLPEQQLKIEVNCYPNPVSDLLRINTNIQENMNIIIYDLLNRPMFQHQFNNSVVIDFSNIPSGNYLYVIYNTKYFLKTGKLLKLE